MANQPNLSVVGLKTRLDQQRQDQIEMLEEILARVKTGDYKALAVVGVLSNFGTFSQIAGSDCAPTLLGAFVIGQKRLIDSMQGGEN